MRIIEFGKKGCQPCQNVSEFLTKNNVEYTFINPFETEDPDELELILENNIKTIPVTILVDENGTVVTRKAGYNEKALNHLIELYKDNK